MFAGRLIGIVERARAKALLGFQVPPPPARRAAGGHLGRACARSWPIQPGWKGLGYGLIMLPVGIVNFTVVVTMWSVALAGATFPLWGWAVTAQFGDNYVIDGWLKVGYIAGVFVVGVLLLMALPARRSADLRAMDRGLIKGLLGGSPTAELRQRVETLTVSRDASVDIAETERRRIERDLHDGVQAQLVTLAMDLGMARQKLEIGDDADPAVLALVERAHDDSKRAVADLRNLVRGIHPAVLTDRGLDAAVSALAARSPIPVEVNISLAIAPAGHRRVRRLLRHRRGPDERGQAQRRVDGARRRRASSATSCGSRSATTASAVPMSSTAEGSPGWRRASLRSKAGCASPVRSADRPRCSPNCRCRRHGLATARCAPAP